VVVKSLSFWQKLRKGKHFKDTKASWGCGKTFLLVKIREKKANQLANDECRTKLHSDMANTGKQEGINLYPLVFL